MGVVMQHHQERLSAGIKRKPAQPPGRSVQEMLSVQGLWEHDPLSQVSCWLGDSTCAAAHAAAIQGRTSPQLATGVHSLLRLQRQYGNQYVQRVIALAERTPIRSGTSLGSGRPIHGVGSGNHRAGGGLQTKDGGRIPKSNEGALALHRVPDRGVLQAQADECNYGEIRSWAITSLTDFTPPAGLADAKASIGAVCTPRNCSCRDGSTATAPGDRAACNNIVSASGGADQSGGGNFMCVGSQDCWFVQSCYRCQKGSRTLVRRQEPLEPSGTATVAGKGSLNFYRDNLLGWCSRADFRSGCRQA